MKPAHIAAPALFSWLQSPHAVKGSKSARGSALAATDASFPGRCRGINYKGFP